MSSLHSRPARLLAAIIGSVVGLVVLPTLAAAPAAAAGTTGPKLALITGEIEQLTLNTPGDVWSGGWLRIGGQDVVLPRNLLLDLPANRVSLQQLFRTAPPACASRQESGLAKNDICNLSGAGGFATVQANRTNAGDVIAGDVFLEKGRQIVSGAVTYVNVDEGSFRVNGTAGDRNTGVLVRLNDPTGRHTVQGGAGCIAGTQNCSPDTRFGLDPENYTAAFSTGYPVCIPSTTPRTFTDTLNLDGSGGTAQLTAVAQPDGTGDVLCPDGNRNSTNIALDSRRLAPLLAGDTVTVKGNIENVAGVSFLSAYSTQVGVALSTNNGFDQPDYTVLNEMFIDAPGFQRNRIRDQFIGASTEADSDVLLWSVHRDPARNQAREFPLGSVVGCEAVGVLNCRRVLGPNTYRIRHDTLFSAGTAKNAKLSACTQLQADPIFANFNICPLGGTTAEEFGILSPLPHEVQARTRRKTLDLAGDNNLKTVDIRGKSATNGQFLFPMGIGLGGIELPNFAEIDVNLLGTPASFDGIPWNLDRRLSPNGCVGGCEATAQPLSPFPFPGMDPRTQSLLPLYGYSDPNYTASPLSNITNRMLSYVDPAKNNFDGDNTVLAWPPQDPPAIGTAPPVIPPGTKGLINGVTPTTGTQGATVVLDGVGFTGATAVAFGGVAASTVTVVSDLQITAVVPSGAASGTVSVTTPTQVLTSAARFTVVPPPTVTRLSPTMGLGGTPVTVTGTGFATATDVTIGGVSTAYTVLSDTTIRTVVPTDAQTGPITVSNVAGSASSQVFQVTAPPPPPAVTGFSPGNGSTGLLVNVTGANLGTATAVYFGGIAATSFTVVNAGLLTAVVPDGAVTGPVSVAAAGGGGSSSAYFQVTPPLPPPAPPVVAGFTPTSGPVGTQVTLSGSNFAGVTNVSFGATPAIFQYTNGTLIAGVPVGAVTGPIQVTTALGGTGVSSTPFTVTAALVNAKPTITSFSPARGNSGTTVTITGANLAGVTAVSVAGTTARSITSVSATKVVFVVGTGTKAGFIRVQAAAGIATSLTRFRLQGVPA